MRSIVLCIFASSLCTIYSTPLFSMSAIAEAITFMQAFSKNPKEVGSLMPSSPWLADAITARIPQNSPISILEAGPGTGAFTKYIVQRMGKQSKLTAVELNEKLYNQLRKDYENNNNVTLINDTVQNAGTADEFDAIISGLPLNNFNSDMVADILEHYESVTKPGGTISWFEYGLGVPYLHALHPNSDHRENFFCIQKEIQKFRNKHETKTDFVWLNVTPAYVYHVTLKH